MNVKIESTITLQPSYDHGGGAPPPKSSDKEVPLSVFDVVNYDGHMAVIYAFRKSSSNPSNETLKRGLQKALSVYRIWAGRLIRKNGSEKGNPIILLNDQGVKFVEAIVDGELSRVMPSKPSPELLKLHPNLKGVEELLQVQITRFSCGSMVVGFTSHHLIADGQATSDFLIAWGKACRGIEIIDYDINCPLFDRTIFTPREPPRFQFEHHGVEFTSMDHKDDDQFINHSGRDQRYVEVNNIHFPKEFLIKLQQKANSSQFDNALLTSSRPYTIFESLMAHLWRNITKARGVSHMESTSVRISVNGRTRLKNQDDSSSSSCQYYENYIGNLVLWAYPTMKVKDLLCQPLHYTAKVIHDAVSKLNDDYFRSFIDFANHKVPEKDLIPMAYAEEISIYPHIEVDSWLTFPFYDLDFGGGCPFIFMPSYFPTEGTLFLLPSAVGDGSIDLFVALFDDNFPTFNEICYHIE